jgi:ATP-dependent helicase/nuclease subunit B
MKSCVYSIASSSAFVDALAAGILEQYGADPLTLSRVAVLLPTRRACRSLREAFLRIGNGAPMLLPDIRPIGDVEEDEILLTSAEAGGVEGGPGLGQQILDLPEAMPGLRRELLLVQLILRFNEQRKTGEAQTSSGLDAAQAAHLARDLAGLIDQVQTEGLDFARLIDIVPEALAAHWQLTLDFLTIVTEFWPKILAEEGFVDPAERRNLLMELQARAWSENPPDHPVIAAGSTGSIPATARLLKTVARLPKGCVVLPGLDCEMADEAWAAAKLDPTHPQFGMAQLLEVFSTQRYDVAAWPAGSEKSAPEKTVAVTEKSPARVALLNQALLPAEQTVHWREGAILGASALDGLTRLDCTGPEEEARTIALMMRQVLETPEQRAALVTPDRSLARRVAAELARWDIEIDDSAGRPLAQTPVGVFLRLTATLVASDLAPVDLLATLKHPLACGGLKAGDFKSRVRLLERLALRGPRVGDGIAGLKEKLASQDEGRILLPWLDQLAEMIAPFSALMATSGADMGALLRAHIALAEALAADDEKSGVSRLWSGEDGEAAAGFVDELHAAGDVLPDVPGQLYPALLEGLMTGRMVRPRFGLHARLAIFGLLEARLQTADLTILGGLNEGTWPPQVDTGPWMSRPMRGAFGLPQPERRIGLTAHDFVQAASASRVVLTRSAKVEGAPTVPARWLLRIQALLDGAGLAWNSQSSNGRDEADYLGWARKLDDPDHAPNPVSAPVPRPPVEVRPRELAVTDIETWVRDPYAIFAKKILGLRALDDIDADPGAADRGTFIHDALDEFVKDTAWPPAADAVDQLLAIGERKFGKTLSQPGVRAFWWPRFQRAAHWFVETLTVAAGEGRDKPLATEVSGKLKISAPYAPFFVKAKADRIDRDENGDLVLIDYKTGAAPSSKQVLAGYSPQLPLEGLIAQAGKFKNVPAASVSAMEYWKISGRDPAGEILLIKGKDQDTPEVLAVARKRLEELIAAFDHESTPYRSLPRPDWAPRYSDYELLARLGEWTPDEDDGDGAGEAS